MTNIEAIRQATEALEKSGVESARLESELLLAHVLGMNRPQLQLAAHRELKEGDGDELSRLLNQRCRRIPLQHLLGTVSFCGLEMKVNPEVLIPRPETEQLAEKAWSLVHTMEEAGTTSPVVMDLGTGSGCLAISMAAHCPNATIFASDISASALETAKENALRHGLVRQVRFLMGDLFSPLPPGTRLDLIVSNPPYIPTAEISSLAPEVQNHDPRLALDGGSDGLLFYRRIAVESRRMVRAGARILLEIGFNQAPAIETLLAEAGWKVEAVEKDYTRRPRFIQARLLPGA